MTGVRGEIFQCSKRYVEADRSEGSQILHVEFNSICGFTTHGLR